MVYALSLSSLLACKCESRKVPQGDRSLRRRASWPSSPWAFPGACRQRGGSGSDRRPSSRFQPWCLVLNWDDEWFVRESPTPIYLFTLWVHVSSFFLFPPRNFRRVTAFFQNKPQHLALIGKGSLHIEQGQGLQEVPLWVQGPPLGTPEGILGYGLSHTDYRWGFQVFLAQNRVSMACQTDACTRS